MSELPRGCPYVEEALEDAHARHQTRIDRWHGRLKEVMQRHHKKAKKMASRPVHRTEIADVRRMLGRLKVVRELSEVFPGVVKRERLKDLTATLEVKLDNLIQDREMRA